MHMDIRIDIRIVSGPLDALPGNLVIKSISSIRERHILPEVMEDMPQCTGSQAGQAKVATKALRRSRT
ncbi:MAG: hypothetical protein ABIF77_19170 [bacterium]